MFSLKLKSLSWKENKICYLFIIVSIALLIGLQIAGFAAIIVWYILLSLMTQKKQ